MKSVKLGLIGCGRVAEERHLPALEHVPGVEVCAVTDLDPARVDAVSDRWGIPTRHYETADLLADDQLDAVGILTPTSSHTEIGIAALDAGKHVLVEKPLALDTSECRALEERASRSPLKVVVGFNLRWHRLVRRARDVIQSGELGRIRAIRSTYSHFRRGELAPDWHRKTTLGGGVSFNEGVHHYDLWRFLLDTGVAVVSSFSRPSEHFEDETCVTNARLEDGTLATAVFTFTTSPNSEIEIYGERGRLLVSCYRFDGLEFIGATRYPGDLGHRLRAGVAGLWSVVDALPALGQGGDFQATFVGLWRHFFDCVTRDETTACTLADGRQAVAVALATIESARTGKPVPVSG